MSTRPTCMMPHLDDDALREFLERYPPRPYLRRPDGSDHPPTELEPVTAADGLWCLDGVPVPAPQGSPRRSQDDSGENCHLWVIDDRGRLCISEAPVAGLRSDKRKHTNLTGGGDASVGGEVWFGEAAQIYLSGSSGRYPPKNKAHLEEAEVLFSAVGFEVHPLGWDPVAGTPRRIWRGQ